MNSVQSLEKIKQRLKNSDRHSDRTLEKTLAEVEKIKKELSKVGVATESSDSMRMPYSSMPKLTAHCWK